ncbi:MAG: hypothetical protein KatS3mg124_0211 [Porticoccaceae bacterium]|nr:MAG: hypothetical protein KatS3mg124_0211 [Porticoccaceae bacterium]
MAQELRGLAHGEPHQGIGEPFPQGDHRPQEAGPEGGQCGEAGSEAAGGGEAAEPSGGRRGKLQGRAAQRLGAAGEDQVRLAGANRLDREVHRQESRAAVDLHRVGGQGVGQAQAQSRHAGRVGLSGEDVDAAEDQPVQGVAGQRLAEQQSPAALHRQVHGAEGAGCGTGLEERGARPVHQVDGPVAVRGALSSSFGHASSPGRVSMMAGAGRLVESRCRFRVLPGFPDFASLHAGYAPTRQGQPVARMRAPQVPESGARGSMRPAVPRR